MNKEGGTMSRTKGWTKAERDQLRELAETKSNQELGDMFDRTAKEVKNALQKYKIKRSPEAIERLQSKSGEENANWKGGISQDNYHYKKIERERYPERVYARETVRKAIRNGKIASGCKCQFPRCRETEDLEAHHYSYEKEKVLDVDWFCKRHHIIMDNERRAVEEEENKEQK